jgi:hypothetical protein
MLADALRQTGGPLTKKERVADAPLPSHRKGIPEEGRLHEGITLDAGALIARRVAQSRRGVLRAELQRERRDSAADMGAGWSQAKITAPARSVRPWPSASSAANRACSARPSTSNALAVDRNFEGAGTSTDAREAQQKARVELY